MQQYPIDFFIFSLFIPTPIDMTHYNESIRSDRKILTPEQPFSLQKRFILKVPTRIGVIEKFSCQS